MPHLYPLPRLAFHPRIIQSKFPLSDPALEAITDRASLNLPSNSYTNVRPRRLEVKPILNARTIPIAAFNSLIALAAARAAANIAQYGRDEPADFSVWEVQYSGVKLLLSKDYQTKSDFSYGSLADAASSLKRQLPAYGYKESSLLLIDDVMVQRMVLARGFIGLIGEVGESLNGTEANSKYGVSGNMRKGSPVETS
ncbi:MAG: hypothetical protein Q9164_000761 [Protoblastenia rupestris]